MSVHSDDVREVFNLEQWLRNDRQIGGNAQVKRKPIQEGELGGAVDVLEVALGSGGTAVALTRVLIAWLRTRRPNTSITVSAGDRSVTVDIEDAKDGAAEAMLKTAMQIVDDR